MTQEAQFAEEEEVESGYGYFSGYKPKSITEQTNILHQLFPGIGFADETIAERPLPPNTEGWFAVPKWQTMAKTYNEAVQMVLDRIKEARNGRFYNYRDGQLGQRHLRQSEKSEKIFRKLGGEQKNYDFLVIAAQFGWHHRGRSIRKARIIMNTFESGLGVFATGIMLLTHPERLKHGDDLYINCAGDEFSCSANGTFNEAPCFFFLDDEVRFCAIVIDSAFEEYGSASVSVPQQMEP